MAQPSRVFLDEIAGTVSISPAQSAAIVTEIASRLERWIEARSPATVIAPSLPDIALQRDGRVWWHQGRVVPTRRVVEALGSLLDSLLQRGAAGRAPAPLVYVVSRATEPCHLAPFASLAEFRAAVARHTPDEPAATIDALLARYLIAVSGHQPLDEHSTISDVRRLRRSGGVPLPRIAEDTGIPLSLLRELEWGVYVNWHPSHAAPSLFAYAERAGLDPVKVVSIVSQEQELPQPANVPVSLVISASFADRTSSNEALTPIGFIRDVETRPTALPFALAAMILLSVAVAAPRDTDTGARQQVVAVHPADTEPVSVDTDARSAPQPDETDPETLDERTMPATIPVGNARSIEQRRRAPAPSRDLQLRRRRAAGASTGVQSTSPDRERHPLMRFARAIAGDGRFKVEPFPRVQ